MVNSSIIYIKSIDEVLQIYQNTIKNSGGGDPGVLNTNSLEAALAFMQNDEYYPYFVDKLTYLVFAVHTSHGFLDGNKRIILALGMKFLLDNGYVFVVQHFVAKMEPILGHVERGKIDKVLLHDIIYSILYEEDYSESLKLRIINCTYEEEEEEEDSHE